MLLEYFSVLCTLDKAAWMTRKDIGIRKSVNKFHIGLFCNRKVTSFIAPASSSRLSDMGMLLAAFWSSICFSYSESHSPCPCYGLRHTKNNF